MAMCSIRGCPGTYEPRALIHAVRHGGQVTVVEGVPTEVCSVCGDTLLAPETVRRLEQLLSGQAVPVGSAPLYEYA
jgi:YgiT-type zinc finger domain-containing protein